MKAYRLIFTLLCLLPSITNAEQLNLVEGDKNIPPIEYAKINSKNINSENNKGLIWSYSHTCSSSANNTNASQINTPDNSKSTHNEGKLFECTESNNTLEIQLIDNRTGTGTINIQAMGRDTNGKLLKDISLKYKINVIARPQYTTDECPEWKTCRVFNGFYLGVDGTSVNELEESSTVRIQYSSYAELSDHIHLYGDILQTTQQEQTEIDPDCTEDCKPEATIAGNIGAFYAINGSSNNDSASRSKILWGPMAEYYIRKLDSSDKFAQSQYFGFRFGLSKVRFFSIAYGTADGIPGGRVKFSGQLPVYNGKALVGLNLNVRADNDAKREGVSPGDSINIYLMTRVDFTRIFTSWSDD